MKLLTKLTKKNWLVCVKNCATIQQVLILKFAFRPEKDFGKTGPRFQAVTLASIAREKAPLKYPTILTLYIS